MKTNIVLLKQKVNPFGGINFVIKSLCQKKISKLIDNTLGKRVKQAKYSYSDIMMSWIYANLCGAERLEDMQQIKSLFNIPDFKIPSPDIIAGIFKSLAEKTVTFKGKKATTKHEFSINKNLNSLMLDIALKLKLINKNAYHTLDYDNVVIETENKDSKKTYTHIYGYQPGVSFIGKIPVYIENRNGNVNAETLMSETLQRNFDLLEAKGIKINKFRSDSAAFQQNIIELMEDKDVQFYIRCVRRYGFREKVEREIKEWSKITINKRDYEVGSGAYTSKRFNKAYRMVVTRTYKDGEYEYRAILTNDWDMSDEQVLHFYNQRGAIERNFDDLKNNFNWRRLPFSYMNENTVFLIISAISNIIYQFIINSFSKKVDFVKNSFRLKNFIFHFITVSSEWIDGNTLKLYTDKNYAVLFE